MKQSLVNDKGMNAIKPQPVEMGIPSEGPTSAPQEKLLAGKIVSFKNAEEVGTPTLKSYNFKE